MRTFSFELNDEGLMEETSDSIIGRISDTYGFDRSVIKLMEASYHRFFSTGRTAYIACDSVAFTNRGVGWSTNFTDIERDEAYDETVITVRDIRS